jgi:hypothetical protein
MNKIRYRVVRVLAWKDTEKGEKRVILCFNSQGFLLKIGLGVFFDARLIGRSYAAQRLNPDSPKGY